MRVSWSSDSTDACMIPVGKIRDIGRNSVGGLAGAT